MEWSLRANRGVVRRQSSNIGPPASPSTQTPRLPTHANPPRLRSVAEEAAGRLLYRTTFGTQKAGGTARNAFDIRLKSPANTNVLATADGSLLALWEAGPPYELDASSLRCLGASDLGGRISLSRVHGALPGTTRVQWLDRWLDRSGLLPLCDAVSAHPRRDAAASLC